MTAAAIAPEPTGELPLFCPPVAVPFQISDAVKFYLRRGGMAVWDTGVGKSTLALGVACLALQNGTADHVIILCEPNKLSDREWPASIREHTRITDWAIYHGPRRKKLLTGLPSVILSTYETFRNDAVHFETTTRYTDGPLIAALQGRRVVIIYDEISKLGNRSSRNYKAHYRLLARLRKQHPELTVIGLTATPHEGGGHEQFFNEMRFVAPAAMPPVKDFEERCIRYRDEYKRPYYHDDGIVWFRGLCEPWISRRRKTDKEVREHFPPFTEQFATCQMHPDQLGIYQRLEDLAWDEQGGHQDVPGLAVLLRQLAGDPMAIRYAAETGDSDLAKMVWRAIGGELEKCSSAKHEELQRRFIDPVMAGGYKMIIFTFFSKTVLPALRDRITVPALFTYAGQQTQAVNDRQVDLFRGHNGPAILLASDSASKGLNAPEASYTVEYEPARTHAGRIQRAGRGHRAFSAVPLTFITMVLERTVEESRAIPSLMERNEQQDMFFGDEDADGYTTAEDRRRMFAMARNRRGAR